MMFWAPWASAKGWLIVLLIVPVRVRLAFAFVVVLTLATAPPLNTPSGFAWLVVVMLVEGLPSATASPSMVAKETTLVGAAAMRIR